MLGRFTGVADSGELQFADDLQDCVKFGDQASADVKKEIDDYIERRGISAPAASVDEAEAVTPQFPEPPILSLNLLTQNVRTIIWCVGFRGDFGWLRVPGAVDGHGDPLQKGCISVPGVYFISLDSFEMMKAGTILVAEEEAKRIVNHMLARSKDQGIPHPR